MSPATPAEEVFTIPPPPWLVRVGLPALALGPAMALVGFPWVFSGGSDGVQITCQVLGMVLLFILVGVLTTSFGSRLTLGQYGATLEKPRWTQSVLYSEVRCLREYRPAGEPPYTQLEPLEPTGSSLRISSSFPDYPRIRQLLAQHVPDFDASVAAALPTVAAPAVVAAAPQPAPVRPPHQPTAQQLAGRAMHRRANSWAVWLSLAAVGAALWMGFSSFAPVATGVGLAVPLLATLVLGRYRGAFQLGAATTDRRPSLILAFWLPIAQLVLIQFIFVKYVSWQTLWPLAGSTAAGLALALLWGLHLSATPRPVGQALLALLIATSYGLAAAAYYNGAEGGLGYTRYTAPVQRKFTESRKGTHYYLEVAAWGPPGAPVVFGTSEARYDHKQIGDTVSLRLYRGRLGADWGELIRTE